MSITTKPGSKIIVDFGIENTGGAVGDGQNITLTAEDGTKVTVDTLEDFTVNPGEIQSGVLEWNTAIDQAEQQYQLCVETENSADCVTAHLTSLPDSTVHRWTHDESSSTALTDSVGSQSGVINGATFTTNAKQGSNALTYNGSGDYVDLGQIPYYSTFTVMGWLNFDTNNSRGTLIDMRSNQGVHIRGEGDGTVELLYYSGSYDIIAQPTVSTDQWYHFALAYDGTDAIAFQDGTEIGRMSAGSPQDLGAAQDALGSKADLSEQYLDGKTDDVIITNEALTASQIQDIINITT